MVLVAEARVIPGSQGEYANELLLLGGVVNRGKPWDLHTSSSITVEGAYDV